VPGQEVPALGNVADLLQLASSGPACRVPVAGIAATLATTAQAAITAITAIAAVGISEDGGRK
jgi:hypothetical protein